MLDKDPALRAHYAKLALKRLRAYPEGKGAEIRERIAAGNLAIIREASSLTWLPPAPTSWQPILRPERLT